MPKIKLESGIYKRAKQFAEESGYSSVDELVTHLVEKELEKSKAQENSTEKEIQEQLRGLGYIE